MKLSVIVPIYNVEKYLPRCLDSLLRQGMEPGDWEVICINDGSPDNCAAILADYQQRHPDIFKVITQENLGVGEARNTGMRIARGEYIGFVDSDDFVADNGYEYLCEHFLEKKPDVLIFDGRKVDDYRIYKEEALVYYGKYIFEGDGVDVYNRRVQSEVWPRFYRRLFLIEHNIWFEKANGEDKIFNFQVFRCNPHVVLTDSSLYIYMTDNKDSIMRTRERGKICQLVGDQLYGLSILSNYLQSESPLLEKGVEACIRGRLNIVYKESYDVCFSRQEWKYYMGKIREMGINRFLCEQENGTVEKMFDRLKKTSCSSYLTYLIVRSMHRIVFKKYYSSLIQ